MWIKEQRSEKRNANRILRMSNKRVHLKEKSRGIFAAIPLKFFKRHSDDDRNVNDDDYLKQKNK